MKLTIDLSDRDAAFLEAQARAARTSIERYVAEIIAQDLDQHRRQLHADDLGRHLDHMAAQAVPEVTSEDMDAVLQEALTRIRPRRLWQPA